EARIAEVAREVYCTASPVRAAEFLAKNRVTHWMITDSDIHTMPYVASLAEGQAPSPEMRVFDFVRANDIESVPTSMVGLLQDSPHHTLYRLLDRLTLEDLGKPRSPVYLSEVQLQWAKGARRATPRSLTRAEIILSIGRVRRRLRPEVT